MTWRGLVASLCALHDRSPLFRFPVGALVCWHDRPEATQPWRIAARRYTEGQNSTYVEYLLLSQGDPRTLTQWGYEPDLEDAP